MQFNIQVIQINEVTGKKNNRGGVYDQVEVVYKREGKVEAKAFPEFANKEIYPILLGLSKDGEYTVTTEKVGEFWKWLSVTASNSGASGTVETSSTSPTVGSNDVSSGASAAKPTGRVIGSNYETAEERKLRRDFEAYKQKVIVAQSSINYAIEFAKTAEPKGTSLTPDQIRQEAEAYYDWVFATATKDLSDIKSDEV